MLEQETRESGDYKELVIQAIFFAYKPYRFKIFLLLLLGLFGRIFLLGNSNIIGLWIDSMCNPPSPCKEVPQWISSFDLNQILILLSTMTFSGLILSLIYRIGFSRVSAKAVSQLYDEVTWRVSRYPMSFFDKNPAGRIITRFSSDYGTVFRMFGGPLAEFIAIIFDIICMTALISIASPYYLPIVLLVIVLNYWVYKLNQKSLRDERRKLSALRSPSIAHFAETTQGASAIRSFKKEKSFMDRFTFLDSSYQSQRLVTVKKITSFSIQMSVLTAFLLLATGTLAYFGVKNNLLSVGSVGVAFSFVVLSYNTVQTFFEWLAQFEEAMIGVERMNNYLRLPIETGAKLPRHSLFETSHPKTNLKETKQLISFIRNLPQNSEINIENLWLSYSKDLPFVLKNINIHIHSGERVGIIGRTGSGKSSLIQALFYLYPFEKGKITIDNKSPDLLDRNQHPERTEFISLESYRRLISYITQEPNLFKGSLRDNLDIERIHKDEEIIKILKSIGLSDLIEDSGLKKSIEERGRNLSSGQRQLICLARCILQNAPIVIMDEATSSIDPHTEDLISKATELYLKNKTQIIIAHRLSTLKSCDRLIWLNNGEIYKVGSPKDLLPEFENANLELLQ